MKGKTLVIFICMLLILPSAIHSVDAINNTIFIEDEYKDKTIYQHYVKFYASDYTESGVTEFYNDVDSQDVIFAHSIVTGDEKFYIVPPGQWISFFDNGVVQGSIPFETFDGLLCHSSTTQIWEILEVYKVKYGTNPNATWDNFGSYVKVGDKLRTCRYW